MSVSPPLFETQNSDYIAAVTGWSYSGNDKTGHHCCTQTAQIHLKIKRASEAHSPASKTSPISKLSRNPGSDKTERNKIQDINL